MSIIDKIHHSKIWQNVMHNFNTLSAEEYVESLDTLCKQLAGKLAAEIGYNFLEPAHPAGTSNYDASHSYCLIKNANNHNPTNDIIVDLSIGQMIPTMPPFIGTRADLKKELILASDEGRVNPEFMEWFSGKFQEDGEPFNVELFFKQYYGDSSWNAFSDKPIHPEYEILTTDYTDDLNSR